jgi:hypothetical protein
MLFNAFDYADLHSRVFRPDFAGYRPNVVESPHGDGKLDAEKRYAHVSVKNLRTTEERDELLPYLELAHGVALKAARAMDIPVEFFPKMEYGALRVLEYPAGATSHRHEDFDLFTLMCYRDQTEKFQTDEVVSSPALEALQRVNRQGHLGEIAAEIGLGPATPHWVEASDVIQHSVVYFAIPDHSARLPRGITVGEWLTARIARSRVYR